MDASVFDVRKYNDGLKAGSLKQLRMVYGEGEYGQIFSTGKENVVAKVVFLEPKQLEFVNNIIARLKADPRIRPHLPFFEDDDEMQGNIENDDWKFKFVDDDKVFAIQYMEKLQPIPSKESLAKHPLTAKDKRFVDMTVVLLETIANLEPACFFPDFKKGNLLQYRILKKRTKGAKRVKITEHMVPVLIDLDSLITYDNSMLDEGWYGVVSTYNVFSTRSGWNVVPESMTQREFNNTCLYVQRVACLCMLVDWLNNNYDMHEKLYNPPSEALFRKTKHDYIFELLEEKLKPLTGTLAPWLFKNTISQPPFNVKKGFTEEELATPEEYKNYEHFYVCRLSFADRTLV